MFNSLKVATESVEPISVDTVVMSEAEAAILIEALPELPASYTLRQQHATTKQELNALISAIETHGLSKSLIAFADHDGVLRGAVPAIPAVEAMEADLSVEQSGDVLAALKDAVTAFGEPAEEVLHPITKMFIWSFLLSWPVGVLITLIKYKSWNEKWEADKRIGVVIPYNTAIEYMNGAIEMPTLIDGLLSMALPTTQEGLTRYMEDVERHLAPAAKLGLHVSKDGRIELDELAKPVKVRTDKVGYREDSLFTIAGLAKRVQDAEAHLRGLAESATRKLSEEAETATGDEAQYVRAAIHHTHEVIHAVSAREAKVLHLVNQVAESIKKFYA